MYRWIKRPAIVIALAILCGQANIALATQLGGRALTLQPSGEATPAQMQQAEAMKNLMTGAARSRSQDAGYFPAPASVTTSPAFPKILPRTQRVTPRTLSVTGFQALLDNHTSLLPPDTMGAVGPNHIMTMLNTEVLIQSKAGATISTVSLRGFWTAPQTGLSGSPFDSHVIYDALSSRWIAICGANARSPHSQIWLAVSATSDPAGTWTFYSFQADVAGLNWADYPLLGVNSKWIAITTNMFVVAGGPTQPFQMWVVDKSTALAGGVLTVTNFPSGFAGNTNLGTDVPAVTKDALEPDLYIVRTGTSTNQGQNDFIELSRITGTAANPVWSLVPDANGPTPGTGLFTAPTPYNTTSHAAPGCPRGIVCAQQLGSQHPVISGVERVINAVVRNGKLWFVHGGGWQNEPAIPDRIATYWYEVDPLLLNTTGNPVIQSGVIDSGIAGGAITFPSIAVNSNNDALIGFSRMGPNRYIETGFVSRLAADPLGAMSAIQLGKVGEAPYYKPDQTGRNRWGDYSATVVDPADDITFWTIQEYAATPDPVAFQDRWATWWDKVTLQPPTIALTLNKVAFNSTTNNTLILTETTVASNPSVNADFYIALKLPGGTLLVMQPDGSFSTVMTPVTANVPVANFNGPVFNYVFTGTEPTGTYTWFAALTTPGTLNVIGALATVSFSFIP